MRKIVSVLVSIFLCHFIYRVRYRGLENVRKLDKCIICPNHSHILDPVWIYPKVSHMYIMAKSELFKNKFASFLLRYFGAFPIRRGQKDARSLIYAIKVLENNKKSNLLIFPEGGILKEDKRRKHITDGATFISAKTEIPIIPVYITENPKRFSKIYITFGSPIKMDKELLNDKQKMRIKSNELLKSIYSLDERNGKFE